jgi:hypothetical protein
MKYVYQVGYEVLRIMIFYHLQRITVVCYRLPVVQSHEMKFVMTTPLNLVTLSMLQRIVKHNNTSKYILSILLNNHVALAFFFN